MKEIDNSRPKILSLKASVGVEEIKFINGGLVLEGKVENYLQDVLALITQTIQMKT